MTAEQMIRKWDLAIETGRHIFTWTEDHALAYLAEHASQSQLIVESGVYMGRSAHVMLSASAAHLWAVDPFMVAGTEMVTRYMLRTFIAVGRCEIIPKRSKPASEMLQHIKGKLDMVWIDDGHAYEDVCYDIDAWLPLLRPGGLMCGHDFETNPVNDVCRAVRDKLPTAREVLPRLWEYRKP